MSDKTTEYFSKEAKLQKVFVARLLIETEWFNEEQTTNICCWLGFCDTAFRDKSSKDKLKDYLLDPHYYLKK